MSYYARLRDLRELLGSMPVGRREKFTDILHAIWLDTQSEFVGDLEDILHEDCGEYQGSWVRPKN